MRGPGRDDAPVTDRVAAADELADRFDPVLGSLLCRFPEQAEAAARRLDAAVAAGQRPGPLHGVLVGVADVIATEECPATGQSHVHEPGWYAGRDAVAVRRLREAGAVVVAKTTVAEHAFTRPDPASPFPVPRNPWDLDRWPGGSSCGSANGLHTGLFTGALGTDSNGSLRGPAALCGVTGIKPTYGLVPSAGSLPLARSLDTVGPLALTVRESVALLAAIAGRAFTTSKLTGSDPAVPWRTDLRDLRIGVPRAELDLIAGLSADCRRVFGQALDGLRELGAEIVEVGLPEALPLAAAQFVTLLAEGFEAHGARLRDCWDEFGRPFRRSIALGGLISAENYLRAQRVRRWAADALRDRLEGLDALATPAWPGTAPRYDDPAGMASGSWLPAIWNAVGFPAIALPMGFGSDGLPLSLQLAGKPWDDSSLAVIADVYQRATGWHERRPAPDPAGTPAPVVLAEPARLAPVDEWAWPGRALAELGIPIDPPDLAALATLWPGLSFLLDAMPDSPVEVGPLATVRV